jgi:hypothetical protein
LPLRDPRARRLAAYGALAALAAGVALGANLVLTLTCGSYILIQAWRIFREPHA